MPEAKRQEFRNIHVTELANYRLPLAGFVSILHRISGLLMFLLLPFILYLLDNSLTSEDTFAYFKGFTHSPLIKLIILALSWAYLHHFCAGIRHLLMDVHFGLVSIPLALLVGLKIFGVF